VEADVRDRVADLVQERRPDDVPLGVRVRTRRSLPVELAGERRDALAVRAVDV
jgi:hypothetical protein